MTQSPPRKNPRSFTWRIAALTAAILAAGMARPPLTSAADKSSAPAAGMFYKLVNNTNGKFTDEQISWTFDGKNYKTLAEASEAPPRMGGGGRIYVKLKSPSTGETYSDFVEFTHNQAGWFGNTTQVDAFVIPLTIELFAADGTSKKVGITESRTALFDAFRNEVPTEFRSCIEGSKQIVSPHRADFQKGKAHAAYFDKYIDDVWAAYATEKKTPGGWTGKVVDGALEFTPPRGGKVLKCPRKPTSEEVLLGTGDLGKLPQFCAAINRHVLADPADWQDPSKFYLAAPANYYAKFWHDHSLNHKAYGFCYDDASQQDTLIHAAKPVQLIITVSWDSEASPAKANEPRGK